MAMGLNNPLPFEVGQEAESKSFDEGYRGAWFRFKIHDIRFQNTQTEYLLEFFDFPDEEITWTKLYQESPLGTTESHGESKLELMMRPCFPPFYHNNRLPDSYPQSDVIVIVNAAWKVGDLVDWQYEGCYWSGRITDILTNGKVKIKLSEPPIGEGKLYTAFSKNLRPSLDWSPEQGWTVPISREYGKYQHCARLVRPAIQGTGSLNLKVGDGRESNSDCYAQTSRSNNEEMDAPRKSSTYLDCYIQSSRMNSEGDAPRKLSTNSDCYIQSSMMNNEEEDAPKTSRKDGYHYSEKITASGHATSVRHADTIEEAIGELEELANKIRWIKGLLQFGFRWSNEMKPSWKFVNRGSQKE